MKDDRKTIKLNKDEISTLLACVEICLDLPSEADPFKSDADVKRCKRICSVLEDALKS